MKTHYTPIKISSIELIISEKWYKFTNLLENSDEKLLSSQLNYCFETCITKEALLKLAFPKNTELKKDLIIEKIQKLNVKEYEDFFISCSSCYDYNKNSLVMIENNILTFMNKSQLLTYVL